MDPRNNIHDNNKETDVTRDMEDYSDLETSPDNVSARSISPVTQRQLEDTLQEVHENELVLEAQVRELEEKYQRSLEKIEAMEKASQEQVLTAQLKSLEEKYQNITAELNVVKREAEERQKKSLVKISELQAEKEVLTLQVAALQKTTQSMQLRLDSVTPVNVKLPEEKLNQRKTFETESNLTPVKSFLHSFFFCCVDASIRKFPPSSSSDNSAMDVKSHSI